MSASGIAALTLRMDLRLDLALYRDTYLGRAKRKLVFLRKPTTFHVMFKGLTNGNA